MVSRMLCVHIMCMACLASVQAWSALHSLRLKCRLPPAAPSFPPTSGAPSFQRLSCAHVSDDLPAMASLVHPRQRLHPARTPTQSPLQPCLPSCLPRSCAASRACAPPSAHPTPA